MRSILASIAVSVLASTANASQPHVASLVQQQTQVAAFARLYGLVRYYYPGDAAQQIDWNRFAVLGVHEAREATGPADLARRLQALVMPLGPGIDIRTEAMALPPPLQTGSRNLVAWRYLGYPQPSDPAYQAARTHRPAGPLASFGISTYSEAPEVAGHTVRLSAEIRTQDPASTHGVGLWLKAHRGPAGIEPLGDTTGQQVADQTWHRYQLTADVPANTVLLMLGVHLTLSPKDAVSADVRNLRLEVKDGSGHWQLLPTPALQEASSQPAAWDLDSPTPVNENPQWHAASGTDPAYLRMSHVAVRPDDLPFPAPIQENRAQTLELGAGLHARVMLTLSDAQARATPERAEALRALQARLSALDDTGLSTTSIDARQADIVVLWNTLHLFYPYQDVIPIDWNVVLQHGLADARDAHDRATQREALQRLMVPLTDAHATVSDMTAHPSKQLPIMLEPIGADWVVVGSKVPDRVRVGDIVVSVDGTPAPALRKHLESLASGQPSSLPWKGLQWIMGGPSDGPPRHFVMRHADGTTADVALRYTEPAWVRRKLPAPLTRLDDDTWYVDLARVDNASLQQHIDDLAHARAVIYDDRGYPQDVAACISILRHLLAHAEHARWSHTPHWEGPGGRPSGFTDLGWDLVPESPHFSSRAIFLSGGNTISAAEAILGYVQDERLGQIVGSRSRGVDGDITWVTLPTRFRAIFTGMKVTHHDGTTRYQAIGTVPDVPVQQTLAGIRDGRDEVLDAAMAIARHAHEVGSARSH